jgi:hypothetical protein
MVLKTPIGHGRSLAVFLLEKGCVVKDVNPRAGLRPAQKRTDHEENDEYDAYCVAAVLIDRLDMLPDALPQDNYWTLAQLVNRRDTLVYGRQYA